ncbi:MAG: SCP2 sterol-binding domain-containing protein [Pseudomonadota bacterium]
MIPPEHDWSSPQWKTLWLEPGLAVAEATINRAFAWSPDSAAYLERLANKHFKLMIARPAISVSVIFSNEGIRLARECSMEVDCALRITQEALTKLLSNTLFNSGTTIIPPGLRIEGDALVLMDIKQLVQSVDIDWAEPLAPLIGGPMAYWVNSFAHNSKEFARSSFHRLRDTTREFIEHERKDAIPDRKIQHVCDDIVDMQLRLDRLTARIAHLNKALEQEPENDS